MHLMDTITLGHLAIDPEGRLAPKLADRPLEFTFDWRGRRCRAELSVEGLAVETDAARIPSTAEGRDLRRIDETARTSVELVAVVLGQH
jgi:hypothetical protein